MNRLAVIVAFAAVIFSGLVHAWWRSGGAAGLLDQAAARVTLVPLDVGGWHGKAIDGDNREFAQAGADSYWMRQYVRRNQVVTVLLMCGRAGRMSIHTPEFCYQGIGFHMADLAQSVRVHHGPRDQAAQFWTARFTKEVGVAGDLRLFWSWNDGSGWRAPANPRWDFRGKPYLYKLYLVHDTHAGMALEQAAGIELLRLLLPELDRALLLESQGKIAGKE